MKIKRNKYLDDLVIRMGNGAIKVVTGIRRCGKTYLVFNLFVDYLLSSGVNADHIVTLALDEKGNERYRDPDELYSYLLERIGDDSGATTSNRRFNWTRRRKRNRRSAHLSSSTIASGRSWW